MLPDGRRHTKTELIGRQAEKEETLNSFPALNTKTKVAASSRNLRTAGPRKQVWQDESRRRLNKLPNG